MSLLPQVPWLFKLGCSFVGLTSIVGASGGHKDNWDPLRQRAFTNALIYGFVGSLGIVISSFATKSLIPSAFFLTGYALFCGSLYHRSFTGEKTYSGKMAPMGGMALIGGWFALAFV